MDFLFYLDWWSRPAHLYNRLHWSRSRCLSLSDAVFLSYLLTCPVSFVNATHKDLPYCWHDSSEVYLLPNLQRTFSSWLLVLRGKSEEKSWLQCACTHVGKGGAREKALKYQTNVAQTQISALTSFERVSSGCFFFFCPQKPTQLANT